MPNKRIPDLTAATAPLAGTELVPLWDGTTTKQVSVTNLTAGRAVAGTQFTASMGNFIPATSGKGVDFSAVTPAAGMTSKVLTNYEEGTFTPTWNGGTLTVNNTCYYTRIGRQVTVIADVTFGTSVAVTDAAMSLPFTGVGAWGGGSINFTDLSATASINVQASTGVVCFRTSIIGGNVTCAGIASKRMVLIATYFTA